MCSAIYLLHKRINGWLCTAICLSTQPQARKFHLVTPRYLLKEAIPEVLFDGVHQVLYTRGRSVVVFELPPLRIAAR
jgi:hypothetical protein